MNDVAKKEEKEYEVQCYVVKNHEEQYSIWPTYKPIPKGWVADGEARNKEACLSHIDKVWTDMRPLSLRKKMAELGMDADTETSGKTYDVEAGKVEAKVDKKIAKKKSDKK